MLLNFTRCFLIIWLNSGSYSFSNESLVPGIEEIQIVYNKYNQIFQNHIKVPKNLRALYKFHKTDIIEDYKGYYGERERNNKKIADLCYMDLLLFPVISPGTSPGTSQSVASELMLIMQYANNPSKVNKGFDITRHLHPGHSGAEIYILRGDYMRKPRVAKVLKKESAKDLESGFLELSNSLIALSLNPDPSNIKMTRILSAGYSYFPGSKEPYIFCMILEMASGKSIKELFHDKYIDHPHLFNNVLINSAGYLAYFHVNSYEKFRNNTIDPDVKKAEMENREKFCYNRIKLMLQDVEFNPNRDLFFNFNVSLENIGFIFGQFNKTLIGQYRSSVQQHLSDVLTKFKSWNLAREDRVITHGDMHIGNLCYKEEDGTSPLHWLTMIDFSSIKRTYGSIGDPAQDMGKFLGSIWKEVALHSAENYGDIVSMKTWYRKLCEWEEVFISAYIKAYAEAELQRKAINAPVSDVINPESSKSFTTNKMATIRERVYFYKLCLYAQFFDDTRIRVEAKAKDLLFYFFMQESGLLELMLPTEKKTPIPKEITLLWSVPCDH